MFDIQSNIGNLRFNQSFSKTNPIGIIANLQHSFFHFNFKQINERKIVLTFIFNNFFGIVTVALVIIVTGDDAYRR